MQSCRLIGIIEKTCFQREWLSVDAKACFVIDASKMYSYHKTVFDVRLILTRSDNMTLFDALGFRWDRSAMPTSVLSHSLDRVCFRFYKMLPEFVWDASVLEGNPFTFPEVKTLLDGVTVGGRKVFDQEQILNLAESSKRLLAMVKSGQFALSKPVFTELNGIVVRKEALEWGVFRGEGQEVNYTPDVGLGEWGRYTPLPTLPGAPELNWVFSDGVAALQTCEPFERATAFFLFAEVLL
jgi:hypothetical protein